MSGPLSGAQLPTAIVASTQRCVLMSWLPVTLRSRSPRWVIWPG